MRRVVKQDKSIQVGIKFANVINEKIDGRNENRMKIDLHVHTKHSFDCEIDIKSLVQRAAKIGLDAIAITDHDNFSAYGIAKKLAENVIIIPAMEITASDGTHIIGLFLKDEIVSRDIFDIIDEIHNQKGLVLIPHPFRPGTGLIYNRDKQHHFTGEDIRKILSGTDLIESINFHCRQENLLETDTFLSLCPDIPQTAGSDAHTINDLGKAYVELEEVESNSLTDIKKALIHSPRLIRYEAYSHETVPEVISIKTKGKKKSLILKTRNLIPSVFRKSIRAIYNKSTRRRSKKPKTMANE